MILFYFFTLIFGLALGSFINVVIYRTKKNKSFIYGRSFCPDCKKTIKWSDNIPIVSYLLLKGRCRHCGKKIKIDYLIVELLTGLVFLVFFSFNFKNLFTISFLAIDLIFYLKFIISILYSMFIVGTLVAIFIYDLKYFIIPNKFVAFGIIVQSLYLIYLSFIQNNFFSYLNSIVSFLRNNYSAVDFKNLMLLDLINKSPIISSMIAGFLAAGFFFILVYISKEKWMGWGDVKYGIFMGLLLGYPKILVGLFIAYLTGAFIGLILIKTKKQKLNSEIPFGPFLCLGSYVALIFGNALINWYFSLPTYFF